MKESYARRFDSIMETIRREVGKGVPVVHAAEVAGVRRRTHQDWLQKGRKLIDEIAEGTKTEADLSKSRHEDLYIKFADGVAEAQGQWITHRMNVIHTASSVDWRAAAWDLERQAPSNFAKTVRNEISGPEGGDLRLSWADLAAKIQNEQIRRNALDGDKAGTRHK